MITIKDMSEELRPIVDRMRANGAKPTYSAIADEINRLGITTPKGKLWTKSQVKSLIGALGYEVNTRGYGIDIVVGEKYFRWTVLEEVDPIINHGREVRLVRCRCDCGTERVIYRQHLITAMVNPGHGSKSCGCLRDETSTKHGCNSKSGPTPEYMIWIGAKKRCFSKNNPSFDHYGERGITMCEEWRNDFNAFLRDMGPRPSDEYSLDRIDPNGNYEPLNCRWATITEQNRNKTTNNYYRYNGRNMQIGEIADELGLNYRDVRSMIDGGILHAPYVGTGQEYRQS